MLAKRLVNTSKLSHDEWLDYRRIGIGGSDVAAICNLSRYKSAVNVYLDKLGQLPPLEDNPKMKAGRMLEPLILKWFEEETGYKVQKRNFIYQHPQHKFMLANIDGWIPKLKAGLECKFASEYAKDDWQGTGAPTEYVLQCNHYMAVTGADRWFIAVLIGGWDFQWRVIERDEELINNLIQVESNFWNDHVLAQAPPAFSHQDTDYLKETFPHSNEDLSIEIHGEYHHTIKQLDEAIKAKKVAEEIAESCKNQIKGLMGEAEKAYWQGELKYTWKTGKKSRVFKTIGGSDE